MSAIDGAKRAERYVLGMPGSGLGIGLAQGPSTPIPSEGGHILAAIDPTDELELRIWQEIRDAGRDDRVRPDVPTYEDLLRGRAIPRIFRAVVEDREGADGRRRAERELAAREVAEQPTVVESWASAAGGRWHDHARTAFLYYGRFLGRVMQAMTLGLLPEAVFLGGSIVLATHPLFGSTFVATFKRHRVHGGFLADLPVYLIRNANLNLDGATCRAAALLG